MAKTSREDQVKTYKKEHAKMGKNSKPSLPESVSFSGSCFEVI